MTEIRKLAAIMFTDMVGYTRLMQRDEKHAKKLRDRHREIQRREIKNFDGEILQYYGDGTLCIFNSSISAVSCAWELQKEFNKEPKIPLRIGIHTGDIVHDEEGIYGDSVNIAARIESMAIPGSVLFSIKVMDDLKNHPEFSMISLGDFNLKNVDRPIEIMALSNPGLNVPQPDMMQGKGERVKKSLAVLPFVNMSNDPENEYFSDGITEEILNVLAKIEEIRVTARMSSFAFKGKSIDIREVAKELNVNHILEGSVRKAGNRVRITAQLISARDGYHIWSENFDRELEDIFSLQDEIAQNITSRLAEKLIVKVKKPATQIKNTDAYQSYLKGNYHWKTWTPESVRKAIHFYDHSIELDPGFSLPYTGLAGAYVFSNDSYP
jgi:TolB-like protein/class 3 adenylate cyclase